MPKLFENNTMGHTVFVPGPDSAEEFDNQIGQKGACLESAVQREIYHRWNPPFRKNLSELLVKETGVEVPDHPKRTKKVKKDGAESEVADKMTEQEFKNYLLAEKRITEQRCDELAQEAAKLTGPLDLSPSTGGRKPGQQYYEAADQILAIVESGNQSEEDVRALLEAKANGITFDGLGGFNRDTIAQMAKVIEDIKNRNRVGSLLS